MYSKDELVSKSISELEDIANNLGIDSIKNMSQEELIYAILDQQAIVEGSKNPLGGKRKRTRILKKDTDRVYSVHGRDGENYDMKKNKVQQPTEKTLFTDITKEDSDNIDSKTTDGNQNKDNMSMENTKDEIPEPTQQNLSENSNNDIDVEALKAELASMPKHRGPKTKREREILSLLEEAQKRNTNTTSENEITKDIEEPRANVEEFIDLQQNAEPVNTNIDFVPEEHYTPTKSDDNNELIEQLQNKMSIPNTNGIEQEEFSQENIEGVWDGDPADGTDFIIVVDLPIEDQGITPNYDMFDNPTISTPTPLQPNYQSQYQHFNKKNLFRKNTTLKI